MANNDRPRAEKRLPAVTIGRRSITAYDPGIALEVCEKIAEGMNLSEALKLPGLPCRSTWYRWCMLHPDLKLSYDIARAISAEGMEEDMLTIAKTLLEGGKEGLTGLQLDAIKAGMAQLRWSAARRDPAKFAERPQVQTVIPIQINTTLNMGQGGLPADQGSIYTMRAARPTAEEITDVDFEPVSEEAESQADPASPGQSERQLPDGLPVDAPISRPALGKRERGRFEKPIGRPKKKHKTPGQTFATIGAYAQRGKPKRKTNVIDRDVARDGKSSGDAG